LPHFGEVFLVNITTKILFAILTVLLTLPVLLFLQNNNDLAPTILLIYFMIFIPAIIILHIISILALVDVVETKSSALDAFHTALRIFKKQWLSSIEFGFILFVILFTAIVILITILILLSIPFGFIGTAILVSGSPFLFFIFNILTGLFLLALILVFGGALVTFQYSAWRFFYKRAEHKTFGLKPFSKLWRMVID
ncbi:hypothetical protein HY771_03770, partial [Candidatus Uhrbacteria bacterium]|nr:hypothetical protein [Candidatus Uhrbacteria bacterium]